MKGFEYDEYTIARTLAIYDVTNGNASKTARITGIPRTTINGWLDNKQVQNSNIVQNLRETGREELQQKSFKAANALLPKIVEKCLDDKAALNDIVKAYKQLVNHSTDTKININQSQKQGQEQSQEVIDDEQLNKLATNKDTAEAIEKIFRERRTSISKES